MNDQRLDGRVQLLQMQIEVFDFIYFVLKPLQSQQYFVLWIEIKEFLKNLLTESFSSILYVILFTVSPTLLNSLITPAPLNAAVFTALGNSCKTNVVSIYNTKANVSLNLPHHFAEN